MSHCCEGRSITCCLDSCAEEKGHADDDTALLEECREALAIECDFCSGGGVYGLCDGCETTEFQPHHQPSCRRPGFSRYPCEECADDPIRRLLAQLNERLEVKP